MNKESFNRVTEEFYNMFKSIHKGIYQGQFISFSYKTGNEFIYRGYRIATDEPLELFAAFYKEDGIYRVRKDIVNELIGLDGLLNYKD